MFLEKIFVLINSKNISAKALMAANLIPIIGVLFWGWDLFNIVILYWAENAIIIFYSILKVFKTDGIRSIFSIPLFLSLFCAPFMIIHLFFLMLLLNRPVIIRWGDFFTAGDPSLLSSIITILPAFFSLLISRGISYYNNFIKKKEYLYVRGVGSQMYEITNRIMTMHFILLVGMLFIITLRMSNMLIIPFIVLKTLADLKAHQREHEFGEWLERRNQETI